jgi:hypothetical protein
LGEHSRSALDGAASPVESFRLVKLEDVARGWAPDPSGRFAQRFWDGTRWTDFVASSDGGQPTTDPLAAGTSFPPPTWSAASTGVAPPPPPSAAAAMPAAERAGAAPAAWYRDPAGRHHARFWSGAVWTTQVVDHGLLSVDAAPPPPPSAPAIPLAAPEEPPTERRRRALIWAAAALGAAAVVVAALLLLGGGGHGGAPPVPGSQAVRITDCAAGADGQVQAQGLLINRAATPATLEVAIAVDDAQGNQLGAGKASTANLPARGSVLFHAMLGARNPPKGFTCSVTHVTRAG